LCGLIGTTPHSHLKWRNDDFLLWKLLDETTVLDYFYASPFYDDGEACLNQARRLGNLDIDPKDWVGYEYRLVHACDNGKHLVPIPLGSPFNYNHQFAVFVIQKVKLNKGRLTPLDCFYIIGGTVYAAPSLGDLLRYRLLHAMESRLVYIEEIKQLTNWNALEGHSFGRISTQSSSLDPTFSMKKDVVYDDDEAVVEVVVSGRSITGFENHVNNLYQSKISKMIEIALPQPPHQMHTLQRDSPIQKLKLTIGHDRFFAMRNDLSLESDLTFFNNLRTRLYDEHLEANKEEDEDMNVT